MPAWWNGRHTCLRGKFELNSSIGSNPIVGTKHFKALANNASAFLRYGRIALSYFQLFYIEKRFGMNFKLILKLHWQIISYNFLRIIKK